MTEQRLSGRLTQYWENMRKNEVMPSFSHFNKAAIEDVWSQCILFVVMPGVEGKPPSISFYTVGDKVQAIYGQDMTGRILTPAQRNMFQGASIVRKIPEVLSNPVPVTDDGQFVNDQSKVVKYRSCLLPFGNNGKVTHILAGLSWRSF